MRLLLVEDNDDLAEALVERLRAEGHAVDRESDGLAAEAALAGDRFDVVVLDIELPGQDGTAVLRAMRRRGDATPVMLLTARSQVDDRVDGLDSGADDYLVKPVDFRELAARVRVLGRRAAGQASDVFVAGALAFDRGARRATLDGVDLGLRHRELQLLEVFVANLGRVVSKEDVAGRIYTFDEAPSLNAVEQLVTRLRRRLEGSTLEVRTLRGLGYLANVVDDARP